MFHYPLHWVYSFRFSSCRFCWRGAGDVVIDCLETKRIVASDTRDNQDDDGSAKLKMFLNKTLFHQFVIFTHEKIQSFANAMIHWMIPTMTSKTEMMRAGTMNILLLLLIARITRI